MKARKGYRKCQRCHKNRAERFFTPKGRICSTCRKRGRSKATHEQHVTSTYGLRQGEWDKLNEFQGNRCAICRGRRRYRLHSDHCHATGLLRGQLCKTCNSRLLPAAKDSVEILQAAIEYLNDPPARRVLGDRFHKEDGE